MNLEQLFEMQKKLDARIVKEKGLVGQDLLPKKILALQVELGELANEWQGFKMWKVNPKPKPNMLEEYVDCLHFILSIGLEHEFDELVDRLKIEILELDGDITKQFTELMKADWDVYEEGCGGYYHEGFELFLGLGERLGFTWEQIERAYLEKNRVNHERQENGY